jgi:hypothetical protein
LKSTWPAQRQEQIAPSQYEIPLRAAMEALVRNRGVRSIAAALEYFATG